MELRHYKTKDTGMRFRVLWIFTALNIVSALLAQAPTKGEDWLSYEPAVVELRGKLIVVSKYGPPGFGENPKTDKKVKVPILFLSRSINVRGNQASDINTESVSGVKEVQLIFQSGIPHRQFIGREVVAKGVLFHSVTGHHYTPVLLEVSEIRQEKSVGQGN
jgi:hypothetical protein